MAADTPGLVTPKEIPAVDVLMGEDLLPSETRFDQPKKTFRQAVSASNLWFDQAKSYVVEKQQEDLVIPKPPEGAPNVVFSREKLESLTKPWAMSLMGKILGIQVRIEVFTRMINYIWQTKGKLEVVSLGKGFYVFKFNNNEDYERALYGGPWFIFEHYIMLTKWKPNFRPNNNCFKSMAVWVRFPELPLEFFEKESLFKIASSIGRPIKVDYATGSTGKGRYARVCIELDLTKPLIDKIWLVWDWQLVVFENLSHVCFTCGKVGHPTKSCPDNHNSDNHTPTSVKVATSSDNHSKDSPPLSSSPDNGNHGTKHDEILNKNNIGNNGSHVSKDPLPTKNFTMPNKKVLGDWVIVNRHTTKPKFNKHAIINDISRGNNNSISHNSNHHNLKKPIDKGKKGIDILPNPPLRETIYQNKDFVFKSHTLTDLHGQSKENKPRKWTNVRGRSNFRSSKFEMGQASGTTNGPTSLKKGHVLNGKRTRVDNQINRENVEEEMCKENNQNIQPNPLQNIDKLRESPKSPQTLPFQTTKLWPARSNSNTTLTNLPNSHDHYSGKDNESTPTNHSNLERLQIVGGDLSEHTTTQPPTVTGNPNAMGINQVGLHSTSIPIQTDPQTLNFSDNQPNEEGGHRGNEMCDMHIVRGGQGEKHDENVMYSKSIDLMVGKYMVERRVFVWNVQGISNTSHFNHILMLVNRYKPIIVVLVEINCTEENLGVLCSLLKFKAGCRVPSIGKRGGIWMLWRNDADMIMNDVSNPNMCNVLFKFNNKDTEFLISGVHAPSRHDQRAVFWRELASDPPPSTPWMLCGDLNEVCGPSEKSGGRPFEFGRNQAYLDCIDTCGLEDIGYSGPKFTWTNNRPGLDCIRERLDRAVCNKGWLELFPESKVIHLPKTTSDHCPLLIVIDKSDNKLHAPFRCSNAWLKHEDFRNFYIQSWLYFRQPFLVCKNNFIREVKRWSRVVFGNLDVKKSRLLDDLQAVQTELSFTDSYTMSCTEANLQKELQFILDTEHLMWNQRSRVNNALLKDANTSYFHKLTKVKSKQNNLGAIKNNLGEWVYDRKGIAEVVHDHFENFLQTKQTFSGNHVNWLSIPNLQTVNIEPLKGSILMNELHVALFQMGPDKSPGPDGIQPIFYQKFWEESKACLLQFVNECFCRGAIPLEINDTFLVMIPKIDKPQTTSDLRPISLCNTSYKLITKVIANRIKPFLNNIINPAQASFIPGRSITDNVILTKEVSHIIYKCRRKIQWMGMKIDLSKAYDSVEWSFIRETLLGFHFPIHLVNIIMSCVSTPSTKILWNGQILDEFKPTRGLRQGDPLSPYLFVLCMERLSRAIEESVYRGEWKPLKINPSLALSHLFYADDVILLGQATSDNVNTIKHVLANFSGQSGLHVNYTKSRIVLPPKMSASRRRVLASISEMMGTKCFGKYLGVPILNGRIKKEDYFFLLEKVQDRLSTWQGKNLNLAGRVTLAKSVLSALPAYVMQTTMVPVTIVKEMEKKIRKFIWNKGDRDRYISLVSWDKLIKPLAAGGLGLRDLRTWNLAFMAKLGWNILKCPDKLWVRVMNHKYLKNSPFLDCSRVGGSSHIWGNILLGRSCLKKGIRYRIGDGADVSLFFDKWLHDSPMLANEPGVRILDHIDTRVSGIIVNNKWNLNILRSTIPLHVLNKIVATPLSCSGRLRDTIVWDDNIQGKFTVKSAYWKIRSTICNIEDWDFNFIWAFKAPAKYKFLTWLILLDGVPSLNFLNSRCKDVNTFCTFCLSYCEDDLHILRDCTLAKQTWNHFVDSNSVDQGDFFMLPLHEWLLKNLKIKGWNQDFITIVWFIWTRRNAWAFRTELIYIKLQIYNIRVAIETNSLVWGTTQVQGKKIKEPQGKNILWKPPQHSFFKVNSDASFMEDSFFATGGAVIRMSDGDWFVGVVSKFKAINPLAAELEAMLSGLKLAWDYKITHLEVEVDASMIMSIVRISEPQEHHLAALIIDINQMLDLPWELIFSHVPRQGNKLAHQLAVYGKLMTEDHKILSEPPEVVMDILKEEMLMCVDRDSTHDSTTF